MTLDRDDIEAIAHRVVELLGDRSATGAVRYVDAAQLADALGVQRDWVYAHAARLGAIRLGGPRGRMRFDLHHATRTLAGHDPAPARQSDRPPRQRQARASAAGVELLPYES